MASEINMNEEDVKVEVIEAECDQQTDEDGRAVEQSYPSMSKSTFHYTSKINPPVYMSTIASTSSYSHDETSRRLHYITSRSNEFTDQNRREYQTSPPSIDKAPLLNQLSNSKPALERETSNTPPSPSTTPPEDKHVWSKSEVELLLDLYEQNKDQLKDPRVRKTKIWEDIAKQLRERLDSDVNGCQCNQKFRNLKADFQKVLEHNGRPGNFKRVCKYYDRLAHLLDYTLTSNGYRSPLPVNFPKTESSNPIMNEHLENSRHSFPREYFLENGHNGVPKLNGYKRKYSDTKPHVNGLHNGHLEQFYSPKRAKSNCNCECNQEIHYLRESIERINNYVLARSAHEEERLRRLEDIHREKLLAMSRFLDIFKEYVHKMA